MKRNDAAAITLKVLFSIGIFFFSLSQVHAQSGSLGINNIVDNALVYPNSEVPKYGKFEITFQVNNSVSTNFQLPYDPAPPVGIATGLGISVDAIFTSPSGKTYIQPAFYYQDFDYQLKGSQEWFYPTSQFSWKVRFAPNETGTWHYRLQAQDASGNILSNDQTFEAVNSAGHGFLRVSKKDTRYFEFDDGTYFPGLGYNLNFSLISWDDPVRANQNNFQIMNQNGIQLIRMWLSQWPIFGAGGSPWASAMNGLGYGGRSTQAFPDNDVSMWLNVNSNPSMMYGWLYRTPAVKPNTPYQVRVTYLIPAPLNGPRIAGYPYGLSVRLGGWLLDRREQYTDPCAVIPASTWGMPSCQEVPGYAYNSPVDANGNPQWSNFTANFTTGSNQNFLDNIYLTLSNVATTGGTTALVDRIEIRQDFGGGQFGPDIMDRGWMAQHLYYDQKYAYAFDKVLELAAQNNIYLRPVIMEKNDEIMNIYDFNGNPAPFSGINTNFYGNWRTMTKMRWVQQAWWRYLQARWGYSPNIHSWELLNEGDPFHTGHYTLTDELGKYMKCRVFNELVGGGDGQICNPEHPNWHMVSTSNWHSFPRDSFWGNASYPNVDFADVHQYVSKQNDPIHYYDTAAMTNDISLAYGAKRPGGAGKPVIRGETGLTDSGTEPGTRDVLADTNGIWLHKYIWGQINSSGLIESYWYSSYGSTGHIYTSTFDLRPQFKPYYEFIKGLPLSNGNYIDVASTISNTNLRVCGQKDPVLGRAHLWIDNKTHTWNNAVNNPSAVIPASGIISFSGMSQGNYAVSWYDTYAGATLNTENLSVDAGGIIALAVNNLFTDTAVKLDKQVQVAAGDINNDTQINVLDVQACVNHILGIQDFGSRADVNSDGSVNVLDVQALVNTILGV